MEAASRWYGNVPLWLRLIGCYGIEGRSYRCRWGEFVADWGLALQYSVYHESASLHVHLIWGGFFFKMPMVINQRDGTEDWCATCGFTLFQRGIHLNWRDRCKILYLPWDWSHVRRTFLNIDGSVHHNESTERGVFESAPEETKQRFDYTYVRESGEVQKRIATVYGEERECRWRWLTWLPFPRRISRSISVDFDGEVGEGTGSWKGGTVGCGWDWKHGETQEQALRRMENELKFSR